MKNLGKKWKSWKSILKQKHFDAHETEEERLADRNPRVLEEQWRFLVEYWSTEKAQVVHTVFFPVHSLCYHSDFAICGACWMISLFL